MIFDVNSEYGQIRIGQAGIGWYNQTEDEFGIMPGWFVLSWKNYNLEFGELDQGAPGIYLTRYVDGDVEHVRTYWSRG